MREFGRVWESLGEFGRILGEFMRVNESLEEFGRVWESLGEFYTSLGELSRVWESLGVVRYMGRF